MRPLLVGVVMLSCLSARPCPGDESAGPGAIVLGLGVGGERRDVLGVSDSRPVSRGAGIASAKVEVLLSERWRSGVAFQIGAGWFDFKEPLGAVNGNIKDQSWLLRARVDRCVALERAVILRLGLGAEYGEARSWTETLLYSEKGPRAFHGGGSLRLGVGQALTPRFEVVVEVEQALFRAHARNGNTQGEYNWFGGATSIALGLNTALTMGRPD